MVRKPTHLKLLAGTARPDRVAPATPALPALDAATPPSWLTDLTALAEFRRLAAVLTANRLLTAGNVGLLAHLVMLHTRITASWMADETPTAALLTVYRRLSGDLGLTSMPVQAPASKPNRFAEIARRSR
jgi:hypothetical protein